MQLPHVEVVVTDYCMWGMPWRKRTRFVVGWGDPADVEKLRRFCHGRGTCSRTNKAHVELSGRNQQGVRMTLLAMAYPPVLCHALAAVLTADARAHFAGNFLRFGKTRD